MFEKRKQRKEAEKQQREQTRLTNEEHIEAALMQAGKIEEPGAKLIKLEEILEDINSTITAENNGITNKANTAYQKSKPLTALPTLGMIVGAFATLPFAPPVGLGLAIGAYPALAGTIIGSNRVKKSVTKKLEAEAKDHLQKLEDLKQSVTDNRDNLLAYIKAHKDEIVHSPHYEQISQRPDLAREFEGVAAQQLAKYKAEMEAAKEAAGKARKPDDRPSLIKKPVLRHPSQPS